MNNRFGRQESFFGKEGQAKIKNVRVNIIGIGGVGSHIIQQLAFLGVGNITVIDEDLLEGSNKNRLIGVKYSDNCGTPKINIAERTIKEIDPDINVIKMKGSVISKESFKCLLNTDYIFGCVDNDGARLFLNEVALAYNIGYFDVSSEILISENEYGGHIIFINGDNPCLYCLNEINPAEARKYLDNPNARKDEEAIYGIDKKVLNGSGPAVVSLNGIIASLAVNEFMLHVTGKRVANKFLTYYGSIGIVRKRNENRKEGCYYCESIKGQREKVDISNYFT